MSGRKTVVLVGWDPDVVDYTKWPGLTPEKLRTALEGDRHKLNSLGYEADWLFIDNADTAYDVVGDALKQKSYDCVLICTSGKGRCIISSRIHPGRSKKAQI